MQVGRGWRPILLYSSCPKALHIALAAPHLAPALRAQDRDPAAARRAAAPWHFDARAMRRRRLSASSGAPSLRSEARLRRACALVTLPLCAVARSHAMRLIVFMRSLLDRVLGSSS